MMFSHLFLKQQSVPRHDLLPKQQREEFVKSDVLHLSYHNTTGFLQGKIKEIDAETQLKREVNYIFVSKNLFEKKLCCCSSFLQLRLYE